MADKIIENNQVSIMGKIDTGFTFSHQVFGEGFYTMELLVRRLSDSEDRIPVMVSERLLDITHRCVLQNAADNSGLITGMKKNITVWFFLFLRGK